MTAFVSAASRNPHELWLFSLSPYFSDDMPKMKQSWLNNIGHRRADVFRKLSFSQLAQKTHCKTLVFVGEVEAKKYPLLGTRAEAVNKQISGSTLFVIPDTDHDVADKRYIEPIKENI
jgi:pimeloyl-ACP methyl ester carboxylesterase